MKNLICIIALLLTNKVFGQVSFVHDFGKPTYSAITMLIDQTNRDNSKIYYSGYDLKPSLITSVKDTVLNGVQFGIVNIGTLPNRFYMALDGLSIIYLYNDKFQLIGEYLNDSKAYSFAVKPKGLTTQQLISGLKILAMLL